MNGTHIWYTDTMEYYSVIKKNEIMPFAATWMQLEIIILSEVRNEIQEMQKGKKNAKRQNGCLRRPYK